MCPVNGLTQKEQFVLIAVVGLFLVGLTVKTLQSRTSAPEPTEMLGD